MTLPAPNKPPLQNSHWVGVGGLFTVATPNVCLGNTWCAAAGWTGAVEAAGRPWKRGWASGAGAGGTGGLGGAGSGAMAALGAWGGGETAGLTCGGGGRGCGVGPEATRPGHGCTESSAKVKRNFQRWLLRDFFLFFRPHPRNRPPLRSLCRPRGVGGLPLPKLYFQHFLARPMAMPPMSTPTHWKKSSELKKKRGPDHTTAYQPRGRRGHFPLSINQSIAFQKPLIHFGQSGQMV